LHCRLSDFAVATWHHRKRKLGEADLHRSRPSSKRTFIEADIGRLLYGGGHWSTITKSGQLVDQINLDFHIFRWRQLVDNFVLSNVNKLVDWYKFVFIHSCFDQTAIRPITTVTTGLQQFGESKSAVGSALALLEAKLCVFKVSQKVSPTHLAWSQPCWCPATWCPEWC
jgi:hypothetical protein